MIDLLNGFPKFMNITKSQVIRIQEKKQKESGQISIFDY